MRLMRIQCFPMAVHCKLWEEDTILSCSSKKSKVGQSSESSTPSWSIFRILFAAHHGVCQPWAFCGMDAFAHLLVQSKQYIYNCVLHIRATPQHPVLFFDPLVGFASLCSAQFCTCKLCKPNDPLQDLTVVNYFSAAPDEIRDRDSWPSVCGLSRASASGTVCGGKMRGLKFHVSEPAWLMTQIGLSAHVLQLIPWRLSSTKLFLEKHSACLTRANASTMPTCCPMCVWTRRPLRNPETQTLNLVH